MNADRVERLLGIMRSRHLALAVVTLPADIKALTGLDSDNAAVVVSSSGEITIYTDFRYLAAARRIADGARVRDLKRLSAALAALPLHRKVVLDEREPHERYLRLQQKFPKGTRFEFGARIFSELRAIKTPAELSGIRAAAALNDEIWRVSKAGFKAGATERELARQIKTLMAAWGDGEAFETIVCVGANAAECHHVPDDTRWDGREPILVDMGVKLDGWCSDMTRILPPNKPSAEYRRVYELVRLAHDAALAALRPGMSAKALDAAGRKVIAKAGYGAAFGHALGHGVGLEIHEAPTASKKSDWELEPGMTVTIEPGIYLEGKLGVRLENLVAVTATGAELLSRSPFEKMV